MLKPGVASKPHTIIYTERPQLHNGEDKYENLPLKPIQVVSSKIRDKLDLVSRLNYEKLYIVEYNIRVRFIGRVHRDSKQQLQDDFIRFHPEAKDSRVADQKSDPTGVGGRTVKRSGSSGVPRFPKNGQHFKPWKDEGTFSSLVSRSLNSY